MRLTRKLFIILLALFSYRTMAYGPLERAYVDLHYALNVQWDQKDAGFYKLKVGAFFDSIRQMKREGLTKQQLLEFITNLKDQKVAEQLSALSKSLDLSRMSEAEILDLSLNFAQEDSGVQWTEGLGVGIGGALVVVLGLTLILFLCLQVISCGEDVGPEKE